MIKLFDYQQEDVDKLAEVPSALIASDKTLSYFCRHIDFADNSTDCWLWTGAKGGELNYGTFAWKVDGKKYQTSAHRFIYQFLYGVIDKALHVDHLCMVKLCVNPFHLEAVTASVNKSRERAQFSSCKSGHPFDSENTYMTTDGHRECRECRRESTRQWRQRNRKAVM